MKKPMTPRQLDALMNDEAGLSTVEYIILLVLIAIVGIGAWNAFGSTIKTKITGSTTRVNTELNDSTIQGGGSH